MPGDGPKKLDTRKEKLEILNSLVSGGDSHWEEKRDRLKGELDKGPSLPKSPEPLAEPVAMQQEDYLATDPIERQQQLNLLSETQPPPALH